MTPNEINSKRFEKAMSGYRPEDVGAFLAEVADYVEEVLDEKAELEQKLMVLADKLEEYREDEDSLRAALIGAQKLGDSVVRESKRKAETIIEEATTKSEQILAEASQQADTMAQHIKQDIEREKDALNKIQAEVARFKGEILSMYRQHIKMINSIPFDAEDYPQPEPQPQLEETTLSVEEIEPAAIEEEEPQATVDYEDERDANDYSMAAQHAAESEQASAENEKRKSDFIISFDDTSSDTPFEMVRNEHLKRDVDSYDDDIKEEFPRRESRHGNLLFGDKYTLTRKD